MRILILSHSSAVENLGGAERSMLEFLDTWRALRPDVEFFVVSREPRGFLQPELEARGIPSFLLTFNSWVLPLRITEPEDVFRTAREDFAAVRALERFIEEWRPDLVITNTIVSPWAAVAAKLAGVPHIWFAHEYGDDHQFQLTREQTFEDIGMLSDLVVVSSRELRSYLAEWIDPARLDVLYPTLDISGMQHLADDRGDAWRDPFTGDESALRVVCVARVARSKGQERLIKAIARLRSEGIRVEAALVGSANPDDHARVTELLAELRVEDRVWLLGEASNPHPFIAAADVGVVVSDSEGFGRVTVEYMAGKAVIGVRTGATVELVAEDETGMLVEPGDIDALVGALRRYSENRDLVEAHGTAALSRVADEIARRHQAPALLGVVDEVVARGSAPIPRLPHLFMDWLDLPGTALQYLTNAGATVDPRNTRVWKLGRLVLGGPRNAVRMLREKTRA